MFPVRRITEKDIQRKMEKQTGGKHVVCNAGTADIVTEYELIEIKNWDCWKHALGQLKAYDFDIPGRSLRVHFFGKMPDLKKKTYIITVFTRENISVSWEFENIKKCDLAYKSYECHEIIREGERFCNKCNQIPEIKELFLVEENMKTVTEKRQDVKKYAQMCSRGRIKIFSDDLLNDIPIKDRLFQKTSHEVLLSLPIHIKVFIEILTSDKTMINEWVLMFMWHLGNRFKYKNGEFFDNDIKIDREEFISILRETKGVIYDLFINLLVSIRDDNTKNLGLYLEVFDIIKKLKRNAENVVQKQIIDLFISKIYVK